MEVWITSRTGPKGGKGLPLGRSGLHVFIASVLFLGALYMVLTLYGGMFLPVRLVMGISMEPTLRAGDLVFLRRVPFSQVRKGDVVAYWTPEAAVEYLGSAGTILHRVIGREVTDSGVMLATRGDNSWLDPWRVTPADYLGVQVLRVPAVGKPVVYLGKLGGLRGVVVVLGFGMAISAVYVPAMLYRHRGGWGRSSVGRRRPHPEAV